MGYNAYYLYKKYITIGDQPPVPFYPETYSVSGDSENPMPLVLKEENSVECGYTDIVYRWHQLPISTASECSAGTKYYVDIYQVSHDGGLSWEDVVPTTTRIGDVYETGSSDCIEYRWVVSTGYVCSGTNKMTREIEEISYDSGTTWTPTGDERAAYPLIEADSPDCGYVPPTPIYRWVNMDITTDYVCDDCPAPPFQGKWLATYTGGTTSSATCDSTSAITENEVTLADLESVLIGDCVTTIGNKAFYDCSGLTSATIGSGVVNIDSYAFSYCRVLTGITIPNSVTNIGRFAFGACNGLSNLTIGSNVTSIDQSAFQYCNSLTSLTIPDSVTSIGPATFQGCSGLTSVTIGSGLTSIQGYTFHNCSSITSLTIPDNITTIDWYAFSYCSGLTSINIPSGVTSINNFTFSNCSSLPSITIPSGVTSIGSSAFQNCSSLASVTIPSGVTSIADYAFKGCSSLTSITVEATTPPTLGYDVFDNTNNCPIYVPASSVNAYKSATNWSNYSSRIQAIS